MQKIKLQDKSAPDSQKENHQVLSPERIEYLRDKKRRKFAVNFTQVTALVLFIVLWELSARAGLIDSFIMSSPSRIIATFSNLWGGDLFLHIRVTVFETLSGFLLGAFIGVCVSVLLWWFRFLSDVAEPFLVVLNSLPKIALGPIIIVWVGAGTPAIIVMALAISLIVTVLEMLHAFNKTNAETIRMAETFGASRAQIFTKIIFPSNIAMLFNSLKINIGLSLVGVIAGEFLVSKAGLGYLIVYGGQVFKLDLVMTSVLILAVVAALMYSAVVLLEKLTTGLLHYRE